LDYPPFFQELMNFGSISSLYLLSKTSKKVGMKISLFDLKSFSQGGTGLTGGTLEVT
jgi:hypothetical protein